MPLPFESKLREIPICMYVQQSTHFSLKFYLLITIYSTSIIRYYVFSFVDQVAVFSNPLQQTLLVHALFREQSDDECLCVQSFGDYQHSEHNRSRGLLKSFANVSPLSYTK